MRTHARGRYLALGEGRSSGVPNGFPGHWDLCRISSPLRITSPSPLLFGILIGQVFDRLGAGEPLAATAWGPVLVFAILAIGRNLIIWVGDIV